MVDWDSDRIDIQWKPPASDGGAPIRHYVVEKKEKGTPHWIEAGKAPASNTMFSATGLKEGAEYEFRVVAVNEAGPGEPSDPSDAHKAKPRFCKNTVVWFVGILFRLRCLVVPKIITPHRKAKVRAGYPLNFPVEFVGEPAPEVTWTLNGHPLPEKIQIECKEGLTNLYVPIGKRGDSGTYHLNLKNDLGKDDADFEIVVQGVLSSLVFAKLFFAFYCWSNQASLISLIVKALNYEHLDFPDTPSPPKGPLEVSDTTKTSTVLHWHAPEDDGGSEVT